MSNVQGLPINNQYSYGSQLPGATAGGYVPSTPDLSKTDAGKKAKEISDMDIKYLAPLVLPIWGGMAWLAGKLSKSLSAEKAEDTITYKIDNNSYVKKIFNSSVVKKTSGYLSNAETWLLKQGKKWSVTRAIIETPARPEWGLAKMDSIAQFFMHDAHDVAKNYIDKGKVIKGLTKSQVEALANYPSLEPSQRKRIVEAFLNAIKSDSEFAKHTVDNTKIFGVSKGVFGRTLSVREVGAKLESIIKPGKGASKTFLYATEAMTNGAAGGRLGIAMQAGIFAQALIKAYNASQDPSLTTFSERADEFKKSFTENIINDSAYFLTMPLQAQATYRLAGLKYVGLDKEGVQKYRESVKDVNMKIAGSSEYNKKLTEEVKYFKDIFEANTDSPDKIKALVENAQKEKYLDRHKQYYQELAQIIEGQKNVDVEAAIGEMNKYGTIKIDKVDEGLVKTISTLSKDPEKIGKIDNLIVKDFESGKWKDAYKTEIDNKIETAKKVQTYMKNVGGNLKPEDIKAMAENEAKVRNLSPELKKAFVEQRIKDIAASLKNKEDALIGAVKHSMDDSLGTFVNSGQRKAAVKELNKTIKTVFSWKKPSTWISAPFQALGKIMSSGLESVSYFRNTGSVSKYFNMRKAGWWHFKNNAVGIIPRFVFAMAVVAPILAKPLTKVSHMIFGKPKHSILDEEEEEKTKEAQENQAQQPQAVSPPITQKVQQPGQTPLMPNTSRNFNTPQSGLQINNNYAPQAPTMAPLPTNTPSEAPIKEDDKKKNKDNYTYIPSSDPYIPTQEEVQAQMQNGAVLSSAFQKADKAEAEAMKYLS